MLQSMGSQSQTQLSDWTTTIAGDSAVSMHRVLWKHWSWTSGNLVVLGKGFQKQDDEEVNLKGKVRIFQRNIHQAEREHVRPIQGLVSEKSVMRFKNLQFLKTRWKSSLLLSDEKEGRRGRQTFDPEVFYKIGIALRKLLWGLNYIKPLAYTYNYIHTYTHIHIHTRCLYMYVVKILISFLISFHWSRVALQCCVSFYMKQWYIHMYPSLLEFPPIRSPQCTQWASPCCAVCSHYLSI